MYIYIVTSSATDRTSNKFLSTTRLFVHSVITQTEVTIIGCVRLVIFIMINQNNSSLSFKIITSTYQERFKIKIFLEYSKYFVL